MINKVIPVKVASQFGPDILAQMYKYVDDQVNALKDSYHQFHTEKLPDWKKKYEGTPREETKNFPWRNASNVVVQVIGQHVDTLQARIMGSIYELSPIWPVSVLGKFGTTEEVEAKRQSIEELLSYCGLNPEELDLYRVESLWCGDTIKFGTGVIKSNQEEIIEQQWIGSENGEPTMKPLLKYFGPKPEKVNLEDFAASIEAPTLEAAKFIWHLKRLTKYDLQERVYQGHYDKKIVDELLDRPDRNGPSPQKIEEYQTKGLNLSDLYNSGEWHLYECWFPYWANGKRHSIICTYHLATKKVVRCVFNFYPDNELAFILARLGYRQDGLLGRGFCDLLEDFQEEVTANHNQRADNRTIANTSIIRVDKNSMFDSQFSFYPNMVIPGEQGSIEALQLGAVYPSSVPEEMLTLKLAEDRSGVGPSTSGMGGLGSGTVGKTSGAYSSMGTMSILQDGNRSVANNITDFKYAHMKAGLLFAKQYAYFGLGSRAQLFGERADIIQEALEDLMGKRLGFNIKAATASINKEVEKQNYLLLTGIMQKHYTAVGQILQAVQNQQIEPVLKDYLIKVINGSNQLMEKVLQSFGIDDKSTILPDTLITKEQKDGKGINTNGTIQSANGPDSSGAAPTSQLGSNSIVPTN